MVELMLEHGANRNKKDGSGNTALAYAATRGHLGVAVLLLKIGADSNVENRQGMTPLMLAASEDRLDVTRFLLQHKAKTDISDFTGRTAMMLAQRTGKPAAIRVVQEAGVKEQSLLIMRPTFLPIYREIKTPEPENVDGGNMSPAVLLAPHLLHAVAR